MSSKLVPKTLEEQESEFGEFIKLFTKGKSRYEICNSLHLNQNSSRYEILLDRFYTEIQDDTKSKSPLKRFSEYCAKQERIIQDLEKLKEHYEGDSFEKDKAYVSACKTQSEILDKIIKTGQQLGIIRKTADKIELVNGLDPRDMREPEILEAKEALINKIQALGGRGDNNSGKVLTFTPENFKREDNSESE